MANFFCAIYATSYDEAYLDGYFTGGDSSYSRYRYIKLTLNGSVQYIRSDAQGGSESDFSAYLSVSPSTTYSWTARLCYEDSGVIIETSYTQSGSFTTPAQTYDIYATITYDANGGTGGPGTQYLSGETTSSSGANISFTIPSSVPTRSGYTFAGWLFPSGYTWQPGDSTVIWATPSGRSYTAVAQWTQGGAKIYIDSGTSWVEYHAYIDNGSGWDAVTPSIDDGTNWG